MFIQTLATNTLLFFRIVLILILSISLHELAHGWAALSQGDDTPKKTGHMTLNPVVHMGWESIIFLCIGGICWGQMPVNPAKFRSPKWGNILVSAAGPLLNLGLAFLFIIMLKLSSIPPIDGILSYQFLYIGASINLSLFIFNLLPIPPLDGFHVFSEIFPALKPLKDSPFGFFALMIIFMTPGFSEGLYAMSNVVIATASGAG
ncbi:site-2 protease family protein [Microseira wollei]|uniref:Peptidase M50 n=1 Tax=Microseira wollei NIES-4236 TaxID=2530354 RepID=A0AAV3XPG1_9CYAN|nr:site-2 protease family protein [Microseira wollei]GET43775.1 peptidase M50 [Microseira wollei NIES-4236]